jgi:4-diphosphocytidyl-2-C-methyl-D-erythritol kinase
MIKFPNAKINLGLNIIEKRPDGFHNIESVFYPVAWADALEILPSENFSFSSSGLEIPGSQDSNLVIKAFEILKKEGLLKGRNVAMHLHKVLPMGAGIGGGSADGAFALKMLNDLFELNLSVIQLQEYAAQMGSDCPFFIENSPKFCYGRGTDFSEIELNLKGKYIVLANPQIHVSTAEAYAGVLPHKPEVSIKNILKMPISDWKGLLINDFEASVLQNHPKIANVKNQMYDLGAQYASMTGSGSTVFGIFENEPNDLDPLFEDCVCWQGVF